MLALFPGCFRTFISADMDILSGEKGCDFSEYVIQELECCFFRAENIIKNPEVLYYFIFFFYSAWQFRISGYRSRTMSRQFYFGNDSNISLLCVCYYFLDVFLGIKSLVFHFIGNNRCMEMFVSCLGIGSVCTYWSEPRIFFDFNPPSLVFCQMKVEIVDFLCG